MPGLQINVAALTDVGRVREINEDAFSVTDLDTDRRLEPEPGPSLFEVGSRGLLLALSDGMGGHAAGEVASALVLESLRKAIASGDDATPVASHVSAAVREANADVVKAAKEDGRQGMGATLTAVLLRGTDAYIAEIGDSRAYVVRAGRLLQLTRDQSLVQFLVDQGALSPEEARTSSRKNVLLQAIGQADEVRVAIGRLALRSGDRFLVCCDGLTNAITDAELQEILGEGDPALACRKMIDLANERGGNDNLTAIVAHVAGSTLQDPGDSPTLSGTFEIIQSFSGV